MYLTIEEIQMKNNLIIICLSLTMSISLLGMHKETFNKAKKHMQNNKAHQAIELLTNFCKFKKPNTPIYNQAQYLLAKAYHLFHLVTTDSSKRVPYLNDSKTILDLLAQQNKSKPIQAKAHYKLGIIYSSLAKNATLDNRKRKQYLQKAMLHFESAENIATKIKLFKIMILSKLEFAAYYNSFYIISLDEKALHKLINYCNDILKLSSHIKGNLGILYAKAFAHLCIGNSYDFKNKKQKQKAKKRFEKVLLIKTKGFKKSEKNKQKIQDIEALKSVAKSGLISKKLVRKKQACKLHPEIISQLEPYCDKAIPSMSMPAFERFDHNMQEFCKLMAHNKQQHECRTCNITVDKLDKNQKLRKCIKCKTIYYCSKECQRKDWPRHKKVCVPIEKH